MGWNTKMIITGDLTQVDLPHGTTSGLREAVNVLKDVEGISIVNMDEKDIVRHKLVTRIVNAYKNFKQASDEQAKRQKGN
jgi:phosphate starvation-inducible PhoH-like protein